MRAAQLKNLIYFFILIECATSDYIQKKRVVREATAASSNIEKKNNAKLDKPNSTELLQPKPWTPNDQSEEVLTCDETNTESWNIYCTGRILDSVMHHKLFSDSKTFVDKPLKYDAIEITTKFDKTFPKNLTVDEMDKTELQKFVDENFYTEGLDCAAKDWNENPVLIARIQDKTLRKWGETLNAIWKTLCRQVKPEVAENPQRYSLLYVPKPFIIPGGRFREMYYWDAYWIIRGLLVSGMHETSRHMIENFVYMVKKYGFIPNGGRVYYLQRSQPPFLSGMVYEYYEATHDIEFIKEVLPVLEMEMEFWDKHRNIDVVIKGQKHQVYQYRTKANTPRPESYREDNILARNCSDLQKKRQTWQDLGSAAESGWDFSSRWFNDSTNLNTIQTTAIVPVDLNAYMCWNFEIISYLYGEAENDEKYQDYRNRFISFKNTFQKVFYVKKESGWYDYNLKQQKHNFDFFPSMATPLFTRCYHSINLAQSERIFYKMEAMGVFNLAGGIPTSLNKDSFQQWDYPNGWSPLNHMIIDGLRRMQQKAFWLAEKWVLSNYRVFLNTRAMWEKYNVIGTAPQVGSGGEYEAQTGFGWTNGVVLDLLSSYSDRLHFVGLENNPDEVAEAVIQREQPVPLLKSLAPEILNNTHQDNETDVDLLKAYTLPLTQQNSATLPQIGALLNICIFLICYLSLRL